MNEWSREEEELLEKYAHLGAAECAVMVGRSASAIRTKAARMGISLRKRYLCPNCGTWVFKPLHYRTGWCLSCTKRDRNRRLQNEMYAEEVRLLQDDRALQATYSKRNRQRSATNRATCPELGKRGAK